MLRADSRLTLTSQGHVTLHHTVIITLLSHLPYISTLAGMNTLTTCASGEKTDSAFPRG